MQMALPVGFSEPLRAAAVNRVIFMGIVCDLFHKSA